MLTALRVDLPESVVAHLVHETVEQYRGAFSVHPKLPSRSVVVVLLDMSAFVGAASNAHHPQKFVDVWTK